MQAYAAFRVILRGSRLRLIARVGGRGSLGSGNATASDPSCGRGRRGSLGPDGGSGRHGLGGRASGGGSAGPVVADGRARASPSTARRPRVTDHRPAMNATSATTTTTTTTRSGDTTPHSTAAGAGLRGFRIVAHREPSNGLPRRQAGDPEQKWGAASTRPARWLGLREGRSGHLRRFSRLTQVGVASSPSPTTRGRRLCRAAVRRVGRRFCACCWHMWSGPSRGSCSAGVLWGCCSSRADLGSSVLCNRLLQRSLSAAPRSIRQNAMPHSLANRHSRSCPGGVLTARL